jgi:hypothetical protein
LRKEKIATIVAQSFYIYHQLKFLFFFIFLLYIFDFSPYYFHLVKGWHVGRIVMVYYAEPDWPSNRVAPYQIRLHDNRLIYAPEDHDNIIRLKRKKEIKGSSNNKQIIRKENDKNNTDIDMDESNHFNIIFQR